MRCILMVRRVRLYVAGWLRPFCQLVVGGLVLTMVETGAQAKGVRTPAVLCEEAIGAAARESRVPGQLMTAIGLVETGRHDPISGAWRPWPWAINVEGRGLYFNSKSEAIAAVRSLQADGVRSIDVGCMQVNLMHHPDAFMTLEEAFDPKRNVSYASRFLTQLFRRSGDWMIAVGWYHSTTSDLAAAYVKKVTAIFPAGKPSLAIRRGAFKSVTLKDATPLVGRDGMIVPSVRLTSSGFAPTRSISGYLSVNSRPHARFGG